MISFKNFLYILNAQGRDFVRFSQRNKKIVCKEIVYVCSKHALDGHRLLGTVMHLLEMKWRPLKICYRTLFGSLFIFYRDAAGITPRFYRHSVEMWKVCERFNFVIEQFIQNGGSTITTQRGIRIRFAHIPPVSKTFLRGVTPF